jgi:hypothetical protein
VEERDRFGGERFDQRSGIVEETVERRRQRDVEAADWLQQPVRAVRREGLAEPWDQTVGNGALEGVVQHSEVGERGVELGGGPRPVVVVFGHDHDPSRAAVDNRGHGHRQRVAQKRRLAGDRVGRADLRHQASPGNDPAGSGAGVFDDGLSEERRDRGRQRLPVRVAGHQTVDPGCARVQVPRPNSAPRRFRAGPAHSRLPAHLVRRVMSLTHPGGAPRTVRGVEAARPTPHQSSDGEPLLRGGFRLFDEHFAS